MASGGCLQNKTVFTLVVICALSVPSPVSAAAHDQENKGNAVSVDLFMPVMIALDMLVPGQ
jgi:hypothetical protein